MEIKYFYEKLSLVPFLIYFKTYTVQSEKCRICYIVRLRFGWEVPVCIAPLADDGAHQQ